MNFNTVHHVAIIVSDYEKSKHFYMDLLGFRLVAENYRKEKKDYKLDLAMGNCQLEIFWKKDSPVRPSQPEARGLRHLAFHVDDIEEAVRELNAAGIETEPIRRDEFTGSRLTFFFDPDGLPLELYEDKIQP